MKCVVFALLIPGLLVPLALSAGATEPVAKQNVIVYKEDGRFGGWPANNGAWSWGNEILVGFIQAYFQARKEGHAKDDEKGAVLRFARSMDGGETWKIELPNFLAADGKEKPATECPGNIDFTKPDFAMRVRKSEYNELVSTFVYSYDRGRTWKGPYKLPNFGQQGVMARTDYLIEGPQQAMLFLTAAKMAPKVKGRHQGEPDEGRIFNVRTTDGGKTWNFVSWIGPDPGDGRSNMPSTARLSMNEIFTTIRRTEPGSIFWIESWLSKDSGLSWESVGKPVVGHGGNPPSLLKLKDGRLSLVYGNRREPYGIRARLSSDNGRTWGGEIILRDDGGNWDLGYPRSVERPDGKIVSVYYFNDQWDRERYVGATIWDPGKPKGPALRK